MGLFRRKRAKADGFAEIVECWQPHEHGQAGNCRMKLKLDVPGVPAQVVDHHEALMNPNRWPEVGMRVAVTVEVDRPDKVDCHWESVFGEMHGGPVLGRAAEMVLGVAGIDADLSKGVPEEFAPPDPRDAGKPPEALVADLNAQYARGEITYEEMADRLQRGLNA